MRVVLVAGLFVGLACGFALGEALSISQDKVVEQFLSWEKQDQRDFVMAAVANDYILRRSIAEDWCATNKNTQAICWNARYMK